MGTTEEGIMYITEERIMYIEVQFDHYQRFQDILNSRYMTSDELMAHLFQLHERELEHQNKDKSVNKVIVREFTEVGTQCEVTSCQGIDPLTLIDEASLGVSLVHQDAAHILLALPEHVPAKDLIIKVSLKDSVSFNQKTTKLRSKCVKKPAKRPVARRQRSPKRRSGPAKKGRRKEPDRDGDGNVRRRDEDGDVRDMEALTNQPIERQHQIKTGKYDDLEISMDTRHHPDYVSTSKSSPSDTKSMVSASRVVSSTEASEASLPFVSVTEKVEVSSRRPGLRSRTRSLRGTQPALESVVGREVRGEADQMLSVAKEKMQMVDGETVYPCGKCPYTTKHLLGLRRHLMLHTGKAYKCTHCKKSYTEKSKLVEHVRVKHEKSLSYPCRKCDKVFTSSRGLVYHNVTVHEQRGTTLQCAFCPKAFSSKYGFVYHTRTIHGEEKIQENIQSTGDAFRPFSQWEKTTKMVPKHQKDRDGFYHCPHDDCNYKSPQMFHIRRHSSVHTGHQFKCEHCHKTFSENYKLKMHMQVKHGNLRYSCDQCSKEFSTKQGLKYHKLSAHGGEAKFVCEECGHKFYSRCMYEGHMNKHKGIKPFSCPDCEKRFYYQTEISMHKKYCGIDRTPKEKPDKYICHICGDEFKKKQVLTEHVNGRHGIVGNYNCICGANFKWRNSLRSHKMKCSMWMAEHGNNFNINTQRPLSSKSAVKRPKKKAQLKHANDTEATGFMHSSLIGLQNDLVQSQGCQAIISTAPCLPATPALVMAPPGPSYTDLYPSMKPTDSHQQNLCTFTGPSYMGQNLGYFHGPDMSLPQGPVPLNPNPIYM